MGEENNQIVLIFIASIAFVVLLAILLILFLLIYQKRIVTQENRLQKLENERQKTLLIATIEGQERERKRLAKDLHDGIGSLLSGLSLNLKFLKNREDPNSEQAQFLTEACNMVEDGIENVRAVSHNLMPATLENFGLLSAMKECVQPLQSNQDLTIKINTKHAPYRTSGEIELGLLRVFQELLQNTLKHAEASEIDTVVDYQEDAIKLQYMDNGKGFTASHTHDVGIGIKNIQSRVESLNGMFRIGQKDNQGQCTEIEIPVPAKEEIT